jgi:hypothetical protein
MPTMASGKATRAPNTAITMPQVRKRLRHTASISPKTEALTTALSRERDLQHRQHADDPQHLDHALDAAACQP